MYELNHVSLLLWVLTGSSRQSLNPWTRLMRVAGAPGLELSLCSITPPSQLTVFQLLLWSFALLPEPFSLPDAFFPSCPHQHWGSTWQSLESPEKGVSVAYLPLPDWTSSLAVRNQLPNQYLYSWHGRQHKIAHYGSRTVVDCKCTECTRKVQIDGNWGQQWSGSTSRNVIWIHARS